MSAPEFKQLGGWDASLQTRIAGVLIQDRLGRVALQLRDDFEHVLFPGHWSLFGGQVEAGETLVQATRRELAEETGLSARPGEIQPFVRLVSPVGSLHFISKLLRRVEPSDIRLGEGCGFAFVQQGQIDQLNIIPAAKTVLNYHFTAS